jgi:hypothetical protein
MARVLSKKLAAQLGMGWYSVELDDDPGPITPAAAYRFLCDERAVYAAAPTADAPYPFAEILAALDAAPAARRAAWLDAMCAAARAEGRS